MSRVVVAVPVWHRPHQLGPMVCSLHDSLPQPRPFVSLVLVVSVDENPDTVLEARAVAEMLDGIHVVRARWPGGCHGDYARKINLVARYVFGDHADWYTEGITHLFTGAADLRFHDGWLDAALAPFDDPAVGLVGTNDLGHPGCADGTHATHFLVSRDYWRRGTVDQPYRVFHEGYWHEWLDNEALETAKARGAYAYAPDSHVEHLHPFHGKAPWDPTYDMHRDRYDHGERVFNERRELWQKTTDPST